MNDGIGIREQIVAPVPLPLVPYGGADSDTLHGEAGDDSYLFGNGSSNDVVSDYDLAAGNVDTVRIAAGLTAQDIAVTRDQFHLYLSITNVDGTADKLTLSNWFNGDAYKIERVEFADGTVWDAAVTESDGEYPDGNGGLHWRLGGQRRAERSGGETTPSWAVRAPTTESKGSSQYFPRS